MIQHADGPPERPHGAHPSETPTAGRPSDLLSLPKPRAEALLDAHFAARAVPAYRARQTLAWLYERDAASFDEMTDLPAIERAALADAFELGAAATASIARSDDGTVKHLWRLRDGEMIESVLIPTADRLTLCISSQAGCAMACAFCATGWSGYRRHLSAGEIVAQYRGARRWAAEAGLGRIRNIVFMGMGEPLANPKGVMPALTLLNRAYGLGARRITVSTVGVVPGILALAARPEQFRLAVSLHAPNPQLRSKLVPIERKYSMDRLFEALHAFDAAGGKRITFEYVMLDEVNDEPAHAAELAERVRPFHAHVNLIPYNAFPGAPWRAPSTARLRAFAAVLEREGIAATVREPRGRDIAAACGQLRAEHETAPPRALLPILG